MARPQLTIGLNIQFQNDETVLPQTSQVKKSWNYKTWNYEEDRKTEETQKLSGIKTERHETSKAKVSAGIQRLREQVPGTEKMTQPKVLLAAVNYMIYLKDRIIQLEECTEPIMIDLTEDSTPEEESVPMDVQLSPVPENSNVEELIPVTVNEQLSPVPEDSIAEESIAVPVNEPLSPLPEDSIAEELIAVPVNEPLSPLPEDSIAEELIAVPVDEPLSPVSEGFILEELPELNSVEGLMDWLESVPVISSSDEEEDLSDFNSMEGLRDWLGSPPVISSEEEDLPEFNSVDELSRWLGIECASA